MPGAEKPYVIAFGFPASAVLKGHRLPQDVTVTADIAVMIRHAGEADAPVAATWRGQQDQSGKAPSKAYRAWDGGLVHAPLARFRRPDGSLFDGRISPQALERSLAAGPLASATRPLRPAPAMHGRTLTQEEYRACRERLSDGRRAAEAEIRRRAAAAVFIGDVLHVPTPGPAWRIDVAPHRAPAPVMLKAVRRLDPEDGDYPLIYRGDRFAAARQAAEAERRRLLDGGHGAEDGTVGVEGGIEVLLPDAFTFDDDWDLLRRALAETIPQAGPLMWEWPRADAEAFLTLRDALAAWPPARDPRLAAAAADFARACAPHRRVWDGADLGRMAARLRPQEPAAEEDAGAAPGPRRP